MTKIIDGRKYSTSTATFIGEDGYSHPGDFSWWSEELYVKKTGEFFLYGEGGPMSGYCEYRGNNEYGGSAKIIPMSEDEAREWAEAHLSYETYVKFFGDVEE